MMFNKKGFDTNLRINATLWSIPILAIGVADTAAPHAKGETAGESEASKSFTPIPITRYPKVDTVNLIVRPPQSVSRGEPAIKKMASLILNDSNSVGAIKNLPAEISEKPGEALRANTDIIPDIVKNIAADFAEPKSAGSQAISDDLVARSTPIENPIENNVLPGTSLSKPNFAGNPNEMRPMDQQRMIYGTSARNADKVYFPQQFGQLADTLQGKSEVKFTSSMPEHGELEKIEGNFPHQANEQANPVALSVDSNQPGATVETEEMSIKGGYFHYGASDLDSDVSLLVEGDGFGKLSTPDTSAETPDVPSEASSGPILFDQSLETSSAS